MSLSESSVLRRRKRNIQEIIQDIDAFNKTADEALEEKQISGGIKIDLDLVVASSCSNILITGSNQFDLTHALKRNATRFDFTENERYYWEKLKDAHKKIQDDGKKYISLGKLNFISGNVQRALEAEADLKQIEEARSKKNGLKSDMPDFEDGAVLFIVNGMSVLHVVASGMSSTKDTGACRVHGRVPISKAKGDSIVIAFKRDIAFGGIFAHLNAFESGINTSHRIERLNFGPRIYGLMTPLAGSEQISLSGAEEYHYFLNIVPTRIFHNGLLGGSTLSYQYSVTFMKKTPIKNPHVHPSIHIHHEFAAMVIEVRKINKSLFSLFLQLFAAIGGIYGTCSLLNVLMQYFMKKYWPELLNTHLLHKGLPTKKRSDNLVFSM